MRNRTRSTLACIVFLSACNYGGDLPVKDVGMSATLNGTSWKPVSATATVVQSGGIEISGIGPSSVLIKTYNLASPGTYHLGVSAPMVGGIALISKAASGWSTPISGLAGQLIITTLTTTHITGQFTFTAAPLSGTGTDISVTAGTFDLPLKGTLGSLAPNAGNQMAAVINGIPYNAGGGGSFLTSTPPTLYVSGYTESRGITIRLGDVSAAGTYALGGVDPVRTIEIRGTPADTGATWGLVSAGGIGSVTVSSYTASRVIGTFTATLVPLRGSATGNLIVTGSFDMGRP